MKKYGKKQVQPDDWDIISFEAHVLNSAEM